MIRSTLALGGPIPSVEAFDRLVEIAVGNALAVQHEEGDDDRAEPPHPDGASDAEILSGYRRAFDDAIDEGRALVFGGIDGDDDLGHATHALRGAAAKLGLSWRLVDNGQDEDPFRRSAPCFEVAGPAFTADEAVWANECGLDPETGEVLIAAERVRDHADDPRALAAAAVEAKEKTLPPLSRGW